MRTFKLISRFYSGLFLANFMVSMSCIFLIRMFAEHAQKILGILFWYKVITIAMVFYTFIYYNKPQLYYYQNLGISKLQLAIITSIADFLLWLMLILVQLRFGIAGYSFNMLLWSVLLIYLFSYLRK